MRIVTLALAAAALAGITPAAAQNAALREMGALRLTSMVHQSEQARRYCGVTRDQEQAFQTRIATTLASGGVAVPVASQVRDGGGGNIVFTSGQPDPSRPHMIVTAAIMHGGAGEAGVCSLSVLARVIARLAPGATSANGLALPADVSVYVDDHAEMVTAANTSASLTGAGMQVTTRLLEQRRQGGGR